MRYSFRQISRKDFSKILKLDKKVYPTQKPVTEEILSNWYSRNPEFGLVLEKGGNIVGYLVAIPLNKESWEELIFGNLAEAEMEDEHIFNSKKDKQIYVHIYHVEKFIQDKKITRLMLEEMMQKTKFKIGGMSAYCVTPVGINLFEKLGFKEGKFISKEHIMEKGKKLFVFELNPEQLKQKTEGGYSLITRCKMLVAKTQKQ